MSEVITIFSIALNLFILMDSIGNVPIFISLLKEIPPKRQRVIIFRDLFIALILIILFSFLGNSLLGLLGISQDAVMIAGGVVLFLIALKMIFPSSHADPGLEISKHKEPFIVPLAAPLVAGPAVLAAVIVYSKQEPPLILVAAIVLAWIATTIILLCSTLLKKILGERGILACERLMGLILTLVAVQMLLHGIKSYIATL